MLIQVFVFSLKSGMARGRGEGEVIAPATSGNETYDRRNRIHLNTIELLIMAIPSMWIFATYVHALAAAGFGLIYVIGRVVYSRAYLTDPSTRGTGFMMSLMPVLVMLIGGFIGVIVNIVKTGQLF